MKTAPLILLAAFGVSMLFACGGGDAADSPAMGGGEMASPSDAAGDEGVQLGSGNSADVDAFLEDYEELIDEYCDFAERFSTASLEEMAQLGQEMAEQGMKMTEYSSRAIAMRASLSADAQESFEDLQKKAEACAEKIGG